MDGVASGQTLQPGLRELLDKAMPQFGELVVVGPDEDEDRGVDPVESVPERFLSPCPATAKACRQSVDPIREPPLETCAGRCESGEKRARQPTIEEGRQPDLVEPLGQRGVGLDTDLASLRLVDPRRDPDEHETANQLRSGQGRVQGHPATHRIADEHSLAPDVGQQFTTRSQIGLIVVGRSGSVAGQVDGHHLMVAGEVVSERPPTATVLGEAVSEHDPFAPAHHLVVQTHPDRMPSQRPVSDLWMVTSRR